MQSHRRRRERVGLPPFRCLAQADEYHANDDIRDVVLRILMVEGQTHPFAVVRAGELDRWVKSGAYTAILAGSYPRREDDADASFVRPSEAPSAASSAKTGAPSPLSTALNRSSGFMRMRKMRPPGLQSGSAGRLRRKAQRPRSF